MRKPAARRQSGAGLSKSETAKRAGPFRPDPAPCNQVSERNPLTKPELTEIATRIRARTAKAIIENGQDLLQAKASMPHGEFLAWLQNDVQMKPRTAQRCMRVAEWVATLPEAKCVTVTHLPPRELYLLAAPSTPPEVADDVIAKADAGETIKTAEVRRQIKEARQSVEAEPTQDPEADDEPRGEPFWETAEYKLRNELKNACLIAAVQCSEAARLEIPPLDAEWRAGLVDLIEKAAAQLSDLRARIEQHTDDAPVLPSKVELPEGDPESEVPRLALEDLAEDPAEDDDDDPLAIPACFKRARQS